MLHSNCIVDISAYLLNRTKNSKNAFSIIRIDGDLSNDNIQTISEIPEIMSIKQVNILNF